MLVPLRDRNHLKTIPFQRVTIGLIALNGVVFLVQAALGAEATEEIWALFGFTPASFIAGGATGWALHAYTLITHMFLHENVWHLLGNMLFLWVFGDNVEDAMGSWRFLGFYLLSGALAVLTEGLVGGSPELPVIGASGAIAACIGAYIMLYPHAKIWILLLFRIPLLLPAWIVVGIFVLNQVIFAALNVDQVTAWFAHLGGFVAGALLVVPLRRRHVRLFSPADKPMPALSGKKRFWPFG